MGPDDDEDDLPPQYPEWAEELIVREKKKDGGIVITIDQFGVKGRWIQSDTYLYLEDWE